MRIHFTAEDLLLTRFVTRPAPLLELSMSIATVLRRDPLFARMSYAGPMTEFVRPNGNAPLFMDPMSVGMADGLDRVFSTPRDYVRSELRLFPATGWARALYNFDRDAWRTLSEALTTAHAALVQPNWERRCLGLRGDVAWRGQIIAEEGIKAALCTLVPGTEWRSSTLHVPAARDRDLELGGRGLVLYPCVGWTGHVMFGDSSDGARCLFYPAITPLPLVDVNGGGNPIAELLGHTRAAVLQAAIEPHTTGDLARELGISAASVSAHTKTLRAAGLLTSERAGKAVFHSASPLGHRLLARHLPAVSGSAVGGTPASVSLSTSPTISRGATPRRRSAAGPPRRAQGWWRPIRRGGRRGGRGCLFLSSPGELPVTADVVSLYRVMLGHRGVTGLWGTGGLVWAAVIAAAYLVVGIITFRVLERVTRKRGTLGAY